ncbi:helicase-associated domain-containing protein [Paenibacillus sp. GCM10023252]|uniref:helicase-associated domain-containing protein n=1 Tax=Paenibacillus sp. GCM10023252 TaxID=3252649 RepID=UPI00360622E3
MNRSEIADKLTDEELQRIMKAACWIGAREKGLGWLEASADPEQVTEALRRMPHFEKSVLASMLRSYGPMPVPEERLLAHARQETLLSGAEVRLGVEGLLASGWLFSVRKSWGERLLFVPRDGFALWSQRLHPCQLRPLARESLQELKPWGRRSRLLSRQLLAMFTELALSGMELTSKGVLPKKTIGRVVTRLDLDEEALHTLHLKLSRHKDYPAALAVMLDTAKRMGLLLQLKGHYRLNERILDRWLAMDSAGREAELIGWMSDRYTVSNVLTAHAAAALRELPAGSWYRTEDLIHWLADMMGFGEDDEEPRLACEGWLAIVQSCGWVEQGIGSHERVFRVTASSLPDTVGASSKDLLIINPDGELLAGPDCDYRLRWELGLIAEVSSDEFMTTYRLTRESVARAVKQGRTFDALSEVLMKGAGVKELPPTVVSMLESWTRQADQLRMEEVILLRCDSPELADQLASHPQVKPLLQERLSSTIYAVSREDAAELRRKLAHAGYLAGQAPVNDGVTYPNLFIQAGSDTADEGAGEDSGVSAGEVYDEAAVHHYEWIRMEHRPIEDWFPELRGVPSMWMQQLRAYHASTRRELLEQALSWRTAVQLRREGELVDFVPGKLEFGHGGWAVRGMIREAGNPREEVLTPDMWQEMRIIVPGLSQPQ